MSIFFQKTVFPDSHVYLQTTCLSRKLNISNTEWNLSTFAKCNPCIREVINKYTYIVKLLSAVYVKAFIYSAKVPRTTTIYQEGHLSYFPRNTNIAPSNWVNKGRANFMPPEDINPSIGHDSSAIEFQTILLRWLKQNVTRNNGRWADL